MPPYGYSSGTIRREHQNLTKSDRPFFQALSSIVRGTTEDKYKPTRESVGPISEISKFLCEFFLFALSRACTIQSLLLFVG